ncbi:PREDICTED: olfactory receptor 14A2-like [Tinamus guttatus]|uniref:olfactory receptor 14A2-like n=1 Tax=Tinamus guttatus TaxID=94827 RepID=UPI00052EBD15|nr:PREDICTED: olfactory receptor 14A2-like [Tinamus guttatus]
MAYDRYNAICRPWYCTTIMSSRAFVIMAAAAWASGFLHALLHTGNTFSIPLCQGNVVEQFFCEIPQILKLSCSDSYLKEIWLLGVGLCLFLACFLFFVVSYMQIFRAVLRILSEQGQHKAIPHMAMVSLCVGIAAFVCLKPLSSSSPALDLVLSILHSVVPPTVNLLFYSMRNKDLKNVLKKLLS